MPESAAMVAAGNGEVWRRMVESAIADSEAEA
jgi:hypothetical protein